MVEVTELIDAMCEVESGGKTNAVSEDGEAYGILQIRKERVMEINRLFKKRLLHEDAFNPVIAKQMCKWYLEYWGGCYERLTKTEVTEEVLARIWQGGQHGWQNPETAGYWDKVLMVLEGEVA